ncbi:MAG: hypothetical protein U9R05_06545, partial [Chloroflexota bacterium]|nr:hypothetical protein [Chloroflexota bacterium]
HSFFLALGKTTNWHIVPGDDQTARVVIPSQRSVSDAPSEESTACVAHYGNLAVASSLPGSRCATFGGSE